MDERGQQEGGPEELEALGLGSSVRAADAAALEREVLLQVRAVP